MLYVVVMGGPGAGKGTQARKLQDALGIPHISSGELFRSHLKNETELGKLANHFIEKGELVPDDVTVEMVRERLSEPDCLNGAILDGFPRTVPQASALDGFLEECNRSITIVPCISVDSDILLKRLSGRWTCPACGHVFHELYSPPKISGICDFDGNPLYQREDDTEETQKHRIDVYIERTAPLIAYYEARGVLVEINGEQSIDEVFKDLLEAIIVAKENGEQS